jgi:hypothetical protein
MAAVGMDAKDDGMRTAISTLKNELMSDDLPEPFCYENMQLIKVNLLNSQHGPCSRREF